MGPQGAMPSAKNLAPADVSFQGCTISIVASQDKNESITIKPGAYNCFHLPALDYKARKVILTDANEPFTPQMSGTWQKPFSLLRESLSEGCSIRFEGW